MAHLIRLSSLRFRISTWLALAGLAAALPATLAAAVTFTVDSMLDQPDDLTIPGTCHTAAGTCTLRAAVMQANRTSGVGATIVVPAGTYFLTIPASGGGGETNGDLNLTPPAASNPVITIQGAGAALTIIDGNQLDRVFRVHALRTATISALTVRKGAATAGSSGGGPYGGGILNQGTLTLTDVVVTSNSAGDRGGGLTNTGSLTVTRTTIAGNNALYGGGIENIKDMTLQASTISGNRAIDGAGIYNSTNLIVTNSTISSNTATGNGGGLVNTGQSNIYSSSIVFNGADSDADAAGGFGAGVWNNNTLGTNPILNLRNTLVAGNYLSGAPVYDDCQGVIGSYGRNLFGTVAAGCSIVNGSGSWTTVNSLSLIGVLQNNGGPTSTHALLPGSNAIDGGDPALGCLGPSSTLVTDQRGAARLIGPRCDIGAVEFVNLDIDGNLKYDALTDGLLVLRYMFGLTGQALIANALSADATRKTPEAVVLHLAGMRALLDVDADNKVDASTDGLLILRYLFGLRGPALINQAVGAAAGRSTAAAIEPYIQSLMP